MLSYSGIAYFVPNQEREYNDLWAEEIRKGGWIKKNPDVTIIISDLSPTVISEWKNLVNKATLAELSKDVQKNLIEKRPDIFEDLYEETVLAGFEKIDSVITGCWYTDDDESSIADLARSLGVNLKFTSYVRYCTKKLYS